MVINNSHRIQWLTENLYSCEKHGTTRQGQLLLNLAISFFFNSLIWINYFCVSQMQCETIRKILIILRFSHKSTKFFIINTHLNCCLDLLLNSLKLFNVIIFDFFPKPNFSNWMTQKLTLFLLKKKLKFHLKLHKNNIDHVCWITTT